MYHNIHNLKLLRVYKILDLVFYLTVKNTVISSSFNFLKDIVQTNPTIFLNSLVQNIFCFLIILVMKKM